MEVTFTDPTHMRTGSDDKRSNPGPTLEFKEDQGNHKVLFTGIMW